MDKVSRDLKVGLYELLISEGLAEQLATIDPRLVTRQGIHRAEVPDRVALHLSRQIERALAGVAEGERVEVGVAVVKALLHRLEELVHGSDIASEILVDPGELLRSITTLQPDGSARNIDAPLIPILDTTLLTNAPDEPRVGHQIKTEIGSANSIDVLMAFVRSSGINPLSEALRRHCSDGGRVRLLTTTYTGSTQRQALDRLVDGGAEVRISYDTSTTRLHAKAWLFHRASGFSTAYIGSSNLTYSAQVSGLEWNVRVSGARNPDVIDKVRAVFETYWENPDFRPYDPDEFDLAMAVEKGQGPKIYISPVAINPLPFQERLLEELAIARAAGRHRNLLVSATGTGKTVMAALDYVRLRSTLQGSRLLFVAHTREILNQSQATFCQAMRDPNFGEQWIGGKRPKQFEHVFASVQSLSHADLVNLPPAHFDVVIVDEFHHAAAPTYDRLLSHIQPVELLALTATPERSDGLPILHWFDGRIAAELRLWDAIDQYYLSPFAYYGIHDGLDLRQVPWKRGTGYDVEGLTNLYTSSDVWAGQVVKEFVEHLDLATVRCLGFCVSVHHAHYMARVFNKAGIAALAISGDTPDSERIAALQALADGACRVLFSVDLFNEGLDVPNVDAVLMLRPTDSPTLFLQQLGRGLRKQAGKSICTVLDFVGQHRREFRFDRRLRALLGGTRKDVAEQVEAGFPYLPAGCHMELDRKSTEIVLESIRSAIPDRWPQKVDELRAMVMAGHDATLAGFLEHSGLELEDIYTGGHCWSDLCEAAGVPVVPAGPQETALRRAVGRLRHVDDLARLRGYRELLAATQPPTMFPSEADQRIARMLVSQLVNQVPRDALAKDANMKLGLNLVWEQPQVRHELIELFDVLEGMIDHVHYDLPNRPDVPLKVHARYTRLEVLAAMGHSESAHVATWQGGVFWMPDAKADLFAFTLDKTDGSFSPTTRYRDYAISRDLIHWESQSITRQDGETGRRYQEHVVRGSDVILFARLRRNDRAFWCLGPATYVTHEGERPMAITWRLRYPLSGDLFTQFAAAVA
jgi:superfamily II DNA or RNA helicase/HKD family nuclease